MYSIEIQFEPEVFNGTKYYFWCILKTTKSGNQVNCGHGWAQTTADAFADATKYFETNVKGKEK